MKNYNLPALGGGAGLRHPHFSSILEENPKINWFEIIVEDFMGIDGPAKEKFNQIAKLYPIIGHSVCMSIGSSDPLDMDYLKQYRDFIREIKSPWAGDHLCFTMVDHTNLNELIPLPFTSEAVENVVSKLKIIQDTLEVPFLIENVTRYLTLSEREMSEAEFISTIIEKSGCGLLLDITNVQINSYYHAYDSWDFIKSLPLNKVGQIHLSGYDIASDGTIIDSHDASVSQETWQLLKQTLGITGPTSVLVERDRKLPPIQELAEEANIANIIIEDMFGNK